MNIDDELISNIFNYFEHKVSRDEFEIIKKRIEDKNHEYVYLDIFIYFYNSRQQYLRLTATFNHDTQFERYDVLKRYIEDRNFYKFRTSMNKLLKDSYYMGHPKTIKNEGKYDL